MKQYLGKAALLAFISFLLYMSCIGFQKIAWGTGDWWGEYSMKWAAAYIVYILFCFVVEVFLGLALLLPERFRPLFGRLVSYRERLGKARWIPALLILILPVWFFQFTALGVAFNNIYIRVLVWFMVVVALSFLFTRGNLLFGWVETLLAVLITSSEFVIAVAFMDVTSYPFSLGWSEGNRLWDYSIMFGRHLYDYPADQTIPVLLDTGRQFIGGLPFLIPGLTIGMERFWVGLTIILPYLLLGFTAFRADRKNWMAYVLTSVWALIFLKQGPIHPPLVLCAVMVALLWRSPLWLAIPLIILTGYAAEASRYTWLFAPGMWIGMLELAGATLHENKLSSSAWLRAISLGLAGMAGGYFGPMLPALFARIGGGGGGGGNVAVTVQSVSASVADQPLLWYRLLPNATYGAGILVGLLIATLPLITLLIYLAASKKWKMNIWQALAIISPLAAFLVVGLIVSTKIGGGGDLHNMDMFLIGLMFTAVIAWEKGGRAWFAHLELAPIGSILVLLLVFALPGLQSLEEMRSRNFAEDVSWLVTLTDSQDGDTLNMIPSQKVANAALDKIRNEVELVRSGGGEILFMDQRQLLTFGFIKNIPFVPDYEKKLLMNEALSSDAGYFKQYYADLAAKRFSLIVSEPLRKPVKDSSYQFGEENNAWVKWVSIPTLCYYEPKMTLDEVGVQLLVPRTDTSNCSSLLPEGAQP